MSTMLSCEPTARYLPGSGKEVALNVESAREKEAGGRGALTRREPDVRNLLFAMMELHNVLQGVRVDHNEAACKRHQKVFSQNLVSHFTEITV